MKALRIPNGIIHISESVANCPHCTRHVCIDEVDEKLYKSKNGYIRHKCKGCKRFIGITSNYMGDIVGYEL
jgi:hypothetical protein